MKTLKRLIGDNITLEIFKYFLLGGLTGGLLTALLSYFLGF